MEQTTVDDTKAVIQLCLKDNFKSSVKVSYSKNANVFHAVVHRKGMVNGIFVAEKSQWADLVKKFEAFCIDVRNFIINDIIGEDVHFCLSIANDRNEKNVLLTILDGFTVYNFANDKT